MAFNPVNALECSLALAARDPAHRPQFYRDLMAAQIFAVQEGPPSKGPGRRVAGDEDTLKIRPIVIDGTQCLPVFSSLERLRAAVDMEVGYIALSCADFFAITRGSAVCLNPGAELGKMFTVSEIDSLLDGSIWRPGKSCTVPEETQVFLGQPSVYPHELAQALSRLFATLRQVDKAYIAHFFDPQRDTEPHTLIAVEVSGDSTDVLAKAGLVAREVAAPDSAVDFICLSSLDQLGGYFRTVEPFYRCEPVPTRTLDNTTRASNPGRIRLSRPKLKLLRPDLFGFRAFLRRFSSSFLQLPYIEEQLQHGDSRAAVVVSANPLLVAAYTDELDCVAVLRFPDAVRAASGLAPGARLLTVNSYGREQAYQPDLIPGPNRHDRWTGFHPIIAELVSDDLARIEARKAQITEAEWERTASLGAAYLSAKPGVSRDGRPVYAAVPAGVVG